MIQKAQIGRGFRGVLNYVFAASAERGHGVCRRTSIWTMWDGRRSAATTWRRWDLRMYRMW